MDLGFLAEYAVPTIMIFCLCIGFIIKNAITTDKINKFIPLIVGAIGGLMNIWINKDITPDIITTGIFSGLSSTGFYELFKKFKRYRISNRLWIYGGFTLSKYK